MPRDPFDKETTCDICGFQGTAQAVGGHVSTTHSAEIRDRVLSIMNANPDGITTKAMAEETGWHATRILRVATKLKKAGLARSGPGRTWVSAEAPKRRGRPKGSRNKPKTATAAAPAAPAAKSTSRKGTKRKSASRKGTNRKGTSRKRTAAANRGVNQDDLMSYIQRSQSRLAREARRAATDSLIEAHQDEFVRDFVMNLTEQQLRRGNGDMMERLAKAMLSSS